MAAMVYQAWTLDTGPLIGYPSHTQRIMVLLSESKECRPKKSPPMPTADSSADPLCCSATAGVLA